MPTMKNAIFLFLLATGLGSCEKAIEKAQEDYIIKIMTEGRWKVTNFDKGADDRTGDFTPYQFQFNSNRTVDAYNNNIVEKSGTWEGNATNRTIYSNFSNASEPLLLLNGTWLISNSSPSFVEANQTVNGEQRFLRLDKI
jgi:hypothetical protein